MASNRFYDGGAYMVSVTLFLVIFLALIVCRFVFADLQRRPLVRETADSQLRENNFLNHFGVAIIVGDHFENGSHGVDPFERKDRARTYLLHIVGLTGSRQTGNQYVLDVGTARFYVRDRRVTRLRDARDPKCEYEETCFCLPYKIMPKAERIATALLQLRNNPALFDQWASQIGAVKPAGQVFTHGH